MVIAVDFSGLHVWAQALAVILLLELCVLLLLVAALTFLLAFGARWLQMHVIPVLNATVPRAKQALELTNQGTERVVRGVAEVHGWRSAIETALRVFTQPREPEPMPQEEIPAAPTERAPSMAVAGDAARLAAADPSNVGATPSQPAAEPPFVVRSDEPPLHWEGDRTTPPAAHAG